MRPPVGHSPVFSVREYMRTNGTDKTRGPNFNDKLTRELYVDGCRPKSGDKACNKRRFSILARRDSYEAWIDEYGARYEDGDPRSLLEAKEETLAHLKRLYKEATSELHDSKKRGLNQDLRHQANQLQTTLFKSRYRGLLDNLKEQLPLSSEAETSFPCRTGAASVPEFISQVSPTLQPGKSIEEHLNALRVQEKMLEMERLKNEWEELRLPRPYWYEMRTKGFVTEAKLSRKDATAIGAHAENLQKYSAIYREKLLDAVLAERKLFI